MEIKGKVLKTFKSSNSLYYVVTFFALFFFTGWGAIWIKHQRIGIEAFILIALFGGVYWLISRYKVVVTEESIYYFSPLSKHKINIASIASIGISKKYNFQREAGLIEIMTTDKKTILFNGKIFDRELFQFVKSLNK